MEFGAVLLKDMVGLCRCCLAEGCFKDLSSEYTSYNGKEIYAEMLLECYDISLTQRTDSAGPLEQFICEACIARLRDAAQFKRQVIETEVRFLDMLDQGLLKPKVEETELDLKTEAEILSDEDMGQFNNLDYEEDSDDAPLRPPAPPRKRKGADARGRRSKLQKGANARKTLTRKRTNLQIIFNNTTVIPFRWRGKFRCFYCGTVVQDYNELTMHTNTHGDCSIEDSGLKAVKGSSRETKIDISKMTCKVCDETFTCFDDVVTHLIVEHKLEYDTDEEMDLECFRLVDLSCYKCLEKFTYFGYLLSHMNTAHPLNCFSCDSCHQEFNKKRHLFYHIKYYHREGGYQCEYCSHHFRTLYILRKHQDKSHFTKCDVCSLKLPTAILKQKHMKEEHPENGLKCETCSKQLQTKQGLRVHSLKCRTQNATYDSADENFEDGTVKREMIKQIKQNIVSIVNMSTVIPFSFYKNKFNCFYCSEDFIDSDDLREHTTTAHPVCDMNTKYIKKTCRPSVMSVKMDISSLVCKVCYEMFTDLDSLLQHLVSKHDTSLHESLKSFIQPYRLVKDRMACPHCPTQVFRFFSTLLRHINSAHTNNNIICAYCGRAFRKEHLLRVHIWRNHKEDQFKCSICLEECSMPSRLYMHMATVHGVKAAKCSKCGERFATQYLRQKHMIDAHDLGYNCSYCNKLFVRNSFMKDHIRRAHLKEKNVQCNVCGMKFFNNILLRNHMFKHSGEKSFHCDVCGERFLWRKGLVRHMKRHNT